MGAKHTIKRYGELWPEYRVSLGLEVLTILKPWIIISGGWAWHFMSEPGHVEYKHAHDHKDIDLFVNPKNVPRVMQLLMNMGFEKVWTRYDKLPSEAQFRRYEKIIDLDENRSVRITIDFFQAKAIHTIIVDGWQLVEPTTLLSFYSSIHSSKACWAVQAASELVKECKDPVKHPALSKNPLQ